jgi:hypothetical protein
MEGTSISQYIISAFIIALYIVFLVYLHKLEKIGCDCALNWRRNYIIAFIVFSLTWNVATMFSPSLRYNLLIAIIVFALALMFLIVTIQYVNKLKKDKCECSKDLTREIMLYYSWIILIVSLIIAAFIVFVLYKVNSIPYTKSNGKKILRVKS